MKFLRLAGRLTTRWASSKSPAEFRQEFIEELTKDPASRKRPQGWVKDHFWLQDFFKSAKDAGTKSEIEKIKHNILSLLQDSGWHWHIKQDPEGKGLDIKRRVWGPIYDRKPGAPKQFGEDWFKHLMPHLVDDVVHSMEQMVHESRFPRTSPEDPKLALKRILETPAHVVARTGVENFVHKNWLESIGQHQVYSYLKTKVDILDTLLKVRKDLDAFGHSVERSDLSPEDALEVMHKIASIVTMMGRRDAFLTSFLQGYKSGPIERFNFLSSITKTLEDHSIKSKFISIVKPLEKLPQLSRDLDKLESELYHVVDMASITKM